MTETKGNQWGQLVCLSQACFEASLDSAQPPALSDGERQL